MRLNVRFEKEEKELLVYTTSKVSEIKEKVA